MPEADLVLHRIICAQEGFVRALALKMAPFPGLAEDIAQQVFLEFLAKGHDWDLTADTRPLLAVMTRNVARRAWREKARAMPEIQQELLEHIRQLAETREAENFFDEEQSALRRCLERLPQKSRQLIRLHYELDIKSVEIARELAMTAEAVRRALFRLREQLRKCVQQLLREGSV
jgi:RNA polymerase sigma factor (sigma-70 family)